MWRKLFAQYEDSQEEQRECYCHNVCCFHWCDTSKYKSYIFLGNDNKKDHHQIKACKYFRFTYWQPRNIVVVKWLYSLLDLDFPLVCFSTSFPTTPLASMALFLQSPAKTGSPMTIVIFLSELRFDNSREEPEQADMNKVRKRHEESPFSFVK